MKNLPTTKRLRYYVLFESRHTFPTMIVDTAHIGPKRIYYDGGSSYTDVDNNHLSWSPQEAFDRELSKTQSQIEELEGRLSKLKFRLSVLENYRDPLTNMAGAKTLTQFYKDRDKDR